MIWKTHAKLEGSDSTIIIYLVTVINNPKGERVITLAKDDVELRCSRLVMICGIPPILIVDI